MTNWNFIVGNSVINRYVRSLYSVAAKSKSERKIAEEFYSIKSYILKIENYDKFLKKISLIMNDGIKFVESIKMELALSNYMSNFLDLLLQNKRISMILDICDAYKNFLDQMDGKKIFHLTFAKDISGSLVKQFTKYLDNMFGKNVECVLKQDKSLIEGIKVQYCSRILDYSLRSRLKRLHNTIRGEEHEN